MRYAEPPSPLSRTPPPPSASMWLAHEMHPSLSEMDALPPHLLPPPTQWWGGCKGGVGAGGSSQPPSCFAADGYWSNIRPDGRMLWQEGGKVEREGGLRF
nr:hypothetical protein [Morchella crassipes]